MRAATQAACVAAASRARPPLRCRLRGRCSSRRRHRAAAAAAPEAAAELPAALLEEDVEVGAATYAITDRGKQPQRLVATIGTSWAETGRHDRRVEWCLRVHVLRSRAMAVCNGWSAAASAATAAAVDAVAAARTAAAVAATAAALHAAAASATIIRELNRVGRSRGSGIWSVSSAASQSCQQRRHCLQRRHRRQPRISRRISVVRLSL